MYVGFCYALTQPTIVKYQSIGEVLFPVRLANANKRYTVNKYPEAKIKIIMVVLT